MSVESEILAALQPLLARADETTARSEWMRKVWSLDHEGEAWVVATNGRALRAVHRLPSDAFGFEPMAAQYADVLRPIFSASRSGPVGLWASRAEALALVDLPWVVCTYCDGRGTVNTCHSCDHEHECMECLDGRRRTPGNAKIGPLTFRCATLASALAGGPDLLEVHYRNKGDERWASFVGVQQFGPVGGGTTRVVLSIAMPIRLPDDSGYPDLGRVPTHKTADAARALREGAR